MLGYIPKSPIISMFVPPWDTSGWYYMESDLSVGSKMYSNSDDAVEIIDNKYLGAYYFVTYNSIEESFDDKQEITFFAEEDIDVYVSMEDGYFPDFLNDWVNTFDKITSTKEVEYTIYRKSFNAETLVVIPAFKADCNHFFTFVLPKKNIKNQTFIHSPVIKKTDKCYQHRSYKNYLTDVFNGEYVSSKYEIAGNIELQNRDSDIRDKFALLKSGSSLGFCFDGTKQIEISFKIEFSKCAKAIFGLESNLKASDRVQLIFDCGNIVYDNKSICNYLSDKENTIKLVLNGEDGKIGIFHNSLFVGEFSCLKGEFKKAILLCNKGDVKFDNYTISDNPEIYVFNEDFEHIESKTIGLTDNAVIEKVNLKNKNTPSIQLLSSDNDFASLSYSFAEVDNCFTFETLLLPQSTEFCCVPTLLDIDCNEALKIAFFKNSLFATDGDSFIHVLGQCKKFNYYPANNFYHIKITVDLVKQTYDLFVDGAKRVEDFRLINNVKNISNVVFTTKNKLVISKIKGYDDKNLCRNIIPDNLVFDVTEPPYNAVGDGITPDTKNIQKAIDDAAYTGGTVYLPKGKYLSGELFLRNDITFWIDDQAVLIGTQNHKEYPLMEPGISLCAARQLGRGLIYGENLSNIRITGGGTVDGNGLYRFKQNDPAIEKRSEDCRPSSCYLAYSKDLSIDNLSFVNPAFWTVVPLSSERIFIKNLSLDCLNTPNRDGIDPVDCHNITISKCDILAGDDGLCFKSSDVKGCENIEVHNIIIQSLASGIKFGTDTFFSFKNAKIYNCIIKNVNRAGISLESVDGAEVDNIEFSNLYMNDVGVPLYIVVGDRRRCPRNIFVPRQGKIKNVLFSDISFQNPYPFSHNKSVREILIIGQSNSLNIENILFRNCNFKFPGGATTTPCEPKTIDAGYPEYDRHGLSPASAITVKNAKNIVFENCELDVQKNDVRQKIMLFNVEDKKN